MDEQSYKFTHKDAISLPSVRTSLGVYVHVQLTEPPTHMHAAQRVQQAAANLQANNTRQHLSARQRRLELMTKANDG
jgi:hypothetical protein